MNDQRMTIRLPDELYQWYRQRAFDNRSSINNEVIRALLYRRDSDRREVSK